MSDATPRGWCAVALRRLAEGGVFTDGDWVESKDQDPNGEVRLVQLADIGVGRFLDRSSRFLTMNKALALGCTFLEPADVLVSRMADPIGRACLFPGSTRPCVTVVDVCIVRPPPGSVCGKWLAGAINSPQFQRATERAASGTTRSRISRSNLGELTIPVPPANEQRRIVAKLDSLQARSRRACEALDAVPPLLEKLRQSILAAAFRGDLTKDWRAKNKDVEPASVLLHRIRAERRKKWEENELAKLRAKGKAPTDDRWKARYEEPKSVETIGLAALPQGWCWATVEELTYESAYGTSRKTSERSDGVPVLGMGNIRDGEVAFERLKCLPSDHDEFPALLLRAGDLLFNRTNSPELVGKTAVFRGSIPCSFASYLIRLRTALVEPNLVSAFINSPFGRAWVASAVSQQVGQANVNGTKLSRLAVPIAPADERTLLLSRIETYLAYVRSLRRSRSEIRAEVERLERSILAKAFAGELVPQDPNDEPAEAMLARRRASSPELPPKSTRTSRPRVRKGAA